MKKKSEKLLSVILAIIAGLCFMPSVGTVFKANAVPEERHKPVPLKALR